MKNIRLLIFLLIPVIGASCKKYMEVLPTDGLVKNEFWKTKEDVNSVLMGAYSALSQMDGLFFKYGEIRGDMVAAGGSVSWDEQQIMNGNIYSNNGLCDWQKFYQVIDYCNEIIEKTPGVSKIDNTFTDFQVKSVLAEAHYLRDLCYFYLVRIFKDVPLVLIPSESDATDFYPAKTDGDSILNFLVADLESYRNYSKLSGGYLTLQENVGRVTRGAYDALLADIALWRFDYNGCIKYVNNILSSDKYILLQDGNSDTKWFDLFYPGGSAESIFELQYSTYNKQSNSMYGLTIKTANQYGPSQKAIDIFRTTNRDPANSDPEEDIRGEKSSISKNSATDYSIWKYTGIASDGVSLRPSMIQNDCGWIFYRLADVILMKAEAYSQIGGFDSAFVCLNKIYQRAFPSKFLDPIARTTTEYEDKIMDQRCKELAFEGKRWFDLMRLGRRNNYARSSTFIKLITDNVTASQRRILATKLTNPLGWYLPISKTELDRNKNLVQNPYYKTTF